MERVENIEITEEMKRQEAELLGEETEGQQEEAAGQQEAGMKQELTEAQRTGVVDFFFRQSAAILNIPPCFTPYFRDVLAAVIIHNFFCAAFRVCADTDRAHNTVILHLVFLSFLW